MKKPSTKTAAGVKPDEEWIRARLRLLREIKTDVLRRVGDEPEDVQAFRRRYEREMKRRWVVSSKAELLAEIDHADIVYGGDFHAHGPAQRTHLKILRAVGTDRPVVLGLEAFPSRAQKWLDLFLKGELDLESLRRKSQWDRVWGFPWENYRPLLEIARKRGFKLLALNLARGRGGEGLATREAHAARLIRDAYVRNPGALIYVVFGDLHLAPAHLPEKVRVELAHSSPREVTIYLNSDRLYFQLAKKGLELSVDVVRLSPTQFCILSSPPWVQWQSLLLFLEKTTEQGLDWDDDDDDEDFDPTDHVAALVRLAARDLGLEFKLDDLAVYTSDDNRIWEYLERGLKGSERETARALVTSGRSFFLPESGVGFLGRSTVNHAAHLAGDYIHARVSGRKRPLWRFPQDFEGLIWSEAVAFFISKLINHKRASETLSDLRAELAMSQPGEKSHEALRLALDQRMSELIFQHQGRRRRSQVRARRKSSYLEAGRILGGMMGERLYLAHRSRKLSLKSILRMMRMDPAGRGAIGFKKDYGEILRLIGNRVGPEPEHGVMAGIKTRKERL